MEMTQDATRQNARGRDPARDPRTTAATACLLLLGAWPLWASAGSFSLDGHHVRYWDSDLNYGDIEYAFDDDGYRNTYLLDCRGRRFLWIKNVRLATGRVTGNNREAEWRELNARSTISNAVYDRACASRSPKSGTLSAEPGYSRQPVELSYSGGSGRWGWEGSLASTHFSDARISLWVRFGTEFGCRDGQFAIMGNDEIDSISFVIDGQRYNATSPTVVTLPTGDPLAFFTLSDAALHDLKAGRTLLLQTDEGDLWTSLEGSSRAFDGARANCYRELRSAGGPALEPSDPVLTGSPRAAPSVRGGSSGEAAGAYPKLRVRERAGEPVVVFEGFFDIGDADNARRLMRETGARTLVLISQGGVVDEAKDLGYFLRSQRLATRAESVCASACVFALAAGIERTAGPDARIGLHRSSLPGGGGSLEDGQAVAALHYQYFKTMGVDPELATIASMVPSDDIHWLSRQEMIDLDLLTRD